MSTRYESRFEGQLILVLLDDRDHPSLRGGRSLWAIHTALGYRTGKARDELIVAPAGFVTDLASIPRIVWSVYPPDGPWVKAAIIHDFLYYTQGTGIWYDHRGVSRNRSYSRAEADAIM